VDRSGLERLRRSGAAGSRSGRERSAGGGEVDPVAAGGGERGCRESGGHGDARGRHGEREAGRVAAACGVDG
jgi:hypothetical protein